MLIGCVHCLAFDGRGPHNHAGSLTTHFAYEWRVKVKSSSNFYVKPEVFSICV